MTKLKKLFPLSFKFCENPKKLILGALIYGAIAMGIPVVLATVINMLLTPFTALACIPIIGWFIILPIYSFVTTILNIALNAVAFAKANNLTAKRAKEYANYLGLDETYAERVYEEISTYMRDGYDFYSSMSSSDYYDYIMSQSKK